MRKKIIIIGGGGHARSVLSVIKKGREFLPVGYVDVWDRGKILGVPWLGPDTMLKSLRKRCRYAVMGLGSVDLSDKRRAVWKKVISSGFDLPVIVSPTAILNEGVCLQAGTVVFDGVIVNVGSKVGQGCILNTGCIIDHDCDIGDFVHLAPGVTLSGEVSVGEHCLLGTGCRVVQGRKITRECLIGAGAVVVKNCLLPGTYLGVPAEKVVRKR